MLEIKKIKKISLANIFAFFYAVIGFIVASGFYGYAIIAAFRTGQTVEPINKFVWFNIGVGLLGGIFTAFFAGLAGWLIGFFVAALYNIFAKRSGGLKLEVEGISELMLKNEDKQEKLFPF